MVDSEILFLPNLSVGSIPVLTFTTIPRHGLCEKLHKIIGLTPIYVKNIF